MFFMYYNTNIVPYNIIGGCVSTHLNKNMFIYSLNIIHLFLLSLDLSIIDILIVRHKLIDSSTWS